MNKKELALSECQGLHEGPVVDAAKGHLRESTTTEALTANRDRYLRYGKTDLADIAQKAIDKIERSKHPVASVDLAGDGSTAAVSATLTFDMTTKEGRDAHKRALSGLPALAGLTEFHGVLVGMVNSADAQNLAALDQVRGSLESIMGSHGLHYGELWG